MYYRYVYADTRELAFFMYYVYNIINIFIIIILVSLR